MDWIHLAHDEVHWHAHVNTVMNLQLPENAVNALTKWAVVSYSTVLHGVGCIKIVIFFICTHKHYISWESKLICVKNASLIVVVSICNVLHDLFQFHGCNMEERSPDVRISCNSWTLFPVSFAIYSIWTSYQSSPGTPPFFICLFKLSQFIWYQEVFTISSASEQTWISLYFRTNSTFSVWKCGISVTGVEQ
jgi:hypothetical protein